MDTGLSPGRKEAQFLNDSRAAFREDKVETGRLISRWQPGDRAIRAEGKDAVLMRESCCGAEHDGRDKSHHACHGEALISRR
ncbi:hypothetical protein SSBR45G_64970 [Bradyrhizobium sp. SSBR45G]|nr:hypothetical protein SSBR45G_64970 [Bradyrhizobium sp. SSBR45G]GLH89006.1 hypothetical protein SSBR45R_64670 [Bradyrhizobium sp. SSBR45R]